MENRFFLSIHVTAEALYPQLLAFEVLVNILIMRQNGLSHHLEKSRRRALVGPLLLPRRF